MGGVLRFRCSLGSSPPARGTPRKDSEWASTHRFIPARAGNTLSQCPVRVRIEVHPRPRGEHAGHSRVVEFQTGSSPPARGTQRKKSCVVQVDSVPVHPRPRGEHPSTVTVNANVTGSSPPARGTLSAECLSVWLSKVHPRPRGEHALERRAVLNLDGSSPPARGTRRRAAGCGD